MNLISTEIPVPPICVGANNGDLNWLGGDIQNTLVPALVFGETGLEAYGQSVPKDSIGGDLADLVTTGEDVIAYVADVSGHGFRAGVLMGMIKTAMRYGLLLGQPLGKLLSDINSVLPVVKKASMFATMAALRFDHSGTAEYISAGHVPLLHYRRRKGDVVRHSMSEFPLGLFRDATYSVTRIPYEAGDVFALVTDGVMEAGENVGRYFGLEGVEQVLLDLPEHPLPEIAEELLSEAAMWGAQEDDCTVLLVRVSGGSDGDSKEMGEPAETGSAGEAIDATWRRMLDALAEELESE